MSIIRSSLLLGAGAAAGGYQTERSLRFNSSDSAYLSRTPASAGNRKTWTWAGWVKRSALGTFQYIWGNANLSAENGFMFRFDSEDVIRIADWTNTAVWQKITTQVFRDVSAWYHIVISYDTTNATAADRVRLYVNGSRITAFSTSTDPTQNYDGYINNTNPDSIGRWGNQANYYFNGYLADIHFIDGQALAPSSFTEVSATTGQLIPKAYTGSFGTNGFKLTFSDNSNNTATTLGKDTSGNGNNWSCNNFSVTAGAGNDSLVDTPTSYGTDTGVGGEVRGNYCTWNPLSKGTDVTLANGNLDMTSSSTGGNTTCSSTFGVSSGKWYWEVTCTGSDPRNGIGVAKNGVNLNSYLGSDSSGWSYTWSAYKYNGSGASYGATYTANDVIGVALDADSGTLTFYKNGTSQGQAYNNLTSGPFFPAIADDSGGGVAGGSLNAGQRPFAYTAPSGFKALCDTNLPVPVVAKPSTVFDTILYSGNNSTQSITSLAFYPDMVWSKCRNVGRSHRLSDAIRGSNVDLYTDTTASDNYYGTGSITTFTANGFNLDNSASSQYNTSGETYVSWCWNAGGSTVSNTSGSITSSVRANTSAGFSVVTWTANNGAATIGHGLGVAPEFIIVKDRDTSTFWQVYHKSMGNANAMSLNSTNAASSGSGNWNYTSPTSTVFSVGISSNYLTDKHVAYCFAPVTGYSSFGSYTGGGSSPRFVYTGFRPKLIWVKNYNSSSYLDYTGWFMWDSVRGTYNYNQANLIANVSNQEGVQNNNNALFGIGVDILSNGFCLRGSDDVATNWGAGQYIYCAWAESPFQYARAR